MSNSPLVNYTKISPNRTSPRNHKIDTITIHCVVGQLSVETIGNIFAPTSRQASSNYGVGKDGRIGMYVEEKDRSWCSSSRSNDNRAVTIEVASDIKHPYAINDTVYKSLINLLVDICKRNGIKELKWRADKSLVGQVDKQNMTVHRWFSDTDCPGDHLYNLHGKIASDVNSRLGTKQEVAKPEPTKQEFKPYVARVSIDNLNMRTGPGVRYPSIGYIKPGAYTIVELSGKWGRLKSQQKHNGKWVNAWIHTNYTKKV